MTNLKRLHELDRYVKVDLRPNESGITVNVIYASGPALSSKSQHVPWSQVDQLPAVIDGLAGERVKDLET